jgi:ribose/xylose/arabinose/galactoside ABC-type transport system permease subunit
MGVLAALAGMVVTARLNSATPKAGTGFELDVIAAVFIGGASMSGGLGPGGGRGDRRAHHGVMNNGMSMLGIGHRLPAGHQGPRAARRRDLRRLQQEQVTMHLVPDPDARGRPP